MNIGFVAPGDFHLGFNSLVRGEGRWCLWMAKHLKETFKCNVYIIGQTNNEYEDDGVVYLNLNNVKVEFNMLFSMDPFINSGITENWMSDRVSRIKTKHRIFAPFFGSFDHKDCIYPVVYPFYYSQINSNGNSTCLPFSVGSSKILEILDGNYGYKNLLWTSKNSHENPRYLYISLKKALEYVKKHNGRLFMIDGHTLLENEYYMHTEVKELLEEFKDFIWFNPKKQWIPYTDVQRILKTCAAVVGIHHPICNPLQVESVYYGLFPIIFENQYELPPYSSLDGFSYIKFDCPEESLNYMYDVILNDEIEYKKMYSLAKDKLAINYSKEVFIKQFKDFNNKYIK